MVESAAVASPDEVRGLVVKAYIVLAQNFKDQVKKSEVARHDLIHELQDHVKKTTAPYKYPRKMEFVDELPKTISGKIKRNELRSREFQKKD